MNNIRAKFEYIWPVPKRIYWSDQRGEYMPHDPDNEHFVDVCIEWDARLDTFTRCQETTKKLLGIIEFMTNTLDDFIEIHEDEPNRPAVFQAVEITKHAKQIMEQIK